MAKAHTVYVCQVCASQQPKWQGRCPECGNWNSLVEERLEKPAKGIKSGSNSSARPSSNFGVSYPLHEEINRIPKAQVRVPSGFTEGDRVLGGGFVPGSLQLFGGEPGIGKSTLLLQVMGHMASQGVSCLYVSGEESGPQVAARAKRLGVKESENLRFIATSDLDEAKAALDELKPQAVVIDSVQTLASPSLDSAAGTVSQVREVAQSFMHYAKGKGIIVLLVGHVTKEGVVAGPRLLEHMVDGVFYFEMSSSGSYRLLRGQKNRFGATHELAVFEMGSHGLVQVENPSQRFLLERAKDSAGSAVVAHMEGSRPLMTEVQALTQKCHHGFPRRTVQGVDQNRVSVLLAVLERSLNFSLADQDVYCKVANGARIEEPASDLALAFALLSSALNRPLASDLIFIGEVGLGGELRSVPAIGARLSEAKGVGIKRAVIPKWNAQEAREVKGIELLPCANLEEARKYFGDGQPISRRAAPPPKPNKPKREENAFLDDY
jgi:DNA repair protein RadA/Sms